MNKLTVNLCIGKPWKASIKCKLVPFVAMEIIFPSGLNFKCVHCSFDRFAFAVCLSLLSFISNGRNVVNGP